MQTIAPARGRVIGRGVAADADDLIAELDQASCKESASILVVDDQAVNLRVAEAFLREEGYEHIVLADQPGDVPQLVQIHDPDVILLDVMMPGISGLDILQGLRGDFATRHVPVIVLTALTDSQTRSRALQLGATDFLTKPLDPFDLLPRVRNAIMLRAHQRELESRAETLDRIVRRRTAELTWTQLRLIHCLARAAENRDNETGRHAVRVGRFARILAEQLGQDRVWCEHLMLAAMLHDVGKIGIPDAILLKPGRLEAQEFEKMKEHSQLGAKIIAPGFRDRMVAPPEGELDEVSADAPMLTMAVQIALTHHERWDGTGYPSGLAGEEIPLEGRVTAVADVFDAVGSVRPYKPAFPVSQCREIICDGAGSHFDPAIVEAFVTRFDDILAVREQLRD